MPRTADQTGSNRLSRQMKPSLRYPSHAPGSIK